MSAISDFLEQEIAKHFAEDTQLPLEDTYVALYTSNPTDADVGTEVSGGSYLRQQVFQDGVTTPFWTTPSGGSFSNSGEIAFPEATADWGLITHVALRDAPTGGNLLFHAPLQAQQEILTGSTFKFNSGELTIQFL